MNKTIIGIVSKHYSKEQIRTDMYIRDEVKQAVFDNNGIAIGLLLPKMEKNKLKCRKISNDFSCNYENYII